ncbi:MAG: prepilin-type N-terminal cleavage/methylation domain-containing protein [bacterium]
MRASPGSGMTLIEILMALAILTVAAGVLMMATSRCLAVVSTAKNYYEARRILEIGELEYPVLVIQKKGEKELKALNLNVGPIDYPRHFTYERTSERSPDKEDLMIVKSRVTWSAKGKSAFEEVTSYLYYTNDLGGL